MPMRADQIRLGKGSPIGEQKIDRLEQADLILVVGPNGSGKSSLLEPLRKLGAAGKVTGVDDGGNRVEFNAKGVQQSVAFISSIDLMTKIRSLSQAIALASDSSRHRVEARILEACIKKLGAAQQPPGDPPELSRLRDTYVDADRQCRDLPRTVEQYEALGQRLAGAAGMEWQGFDPDPATGPARENVLRPYFKGLPGLDTIGPILTELAGLRVTDRSAGGPAQEAAAAASAVEDYLALIRNGSKLPPGHGSAEALDWLRKAVESLQASLDAKDHLAACRRAARSYFDARAGDDHAKDCPVCGQSIDAGAVHRRLDMMGPQGGADGDPEYTDLQCQHGLYAGWRNELDARVGTLGRARRTAEEAFERHRGTLRRLNESLRVATEWDPVVRGKAKDMSDAVARWLSAYPSGASVSAEVDLDALAKRAHDAARELGARQSELSNRHAPLVSAFNHLERLGRLLRAREALNGFDHVVDLDERETAQRRDARREAWRRVLGEMKAARTQAAEEAGDRALSSDAIRERFTRLMGKFADIDPWLAGLSFDGRDAGTAGAANHGTTQITALSEGQTVLVNLAAALTVASVVAGKEDHLPRWVVLDEPTNALDRDAVRCVADYLGSLTLEDLPSQIFVATFDQEFAQRLQGGAARAGRRIRRIELDRFDRGQRGFRMLRDETHAPDDQPRIR